MKEHWIVKLDRLVIILVALHSFGFGIALLWAPAWGFKFGGWDEVSPLFFARQSGIFHIVVATGYLIEYYRYNGILLLLTAKGLATVFLLASALTGEHAWVVPFSGVADAMMGIVVFLIHRHVVKLRNN
jgi:hypothetical protein